ncbi:glycine cleavage system protein GcvH [Phragmitibacter flavus]|uniref:Glycine cleavage system H protein n=1 Tax=Phragmitibacter flavus TaxID=2576071 RepID=A0A5R8KDB2_9BACT|nr:glycine cleavage system protein GcvH [Phragmitibacter flavus]TLD70304.1 glycine cleavage system protein GcvH [Phragmitibacter flavus]
MSKVPDQLRYRESHEWIDPTSGAVGITDHAQHELTDVVFVELPKVGAEVEAGDQIAVVESVKAASDIYSPVSGEIIAINDELLEDPSLINTDPYGEGWIFEIKPSKDAELKILLDAPSYRQHIA